MFHRHGKSGGLSLALQGGGAHGAYTWGVLDALLEQGLWRFDGVSGTSAGAMNAVALAQGYMEGGADGARTALAQFWNGVADSVPPDVLQSLPLRGDAAMSASAAMLMQLTRWFSPYQLNPYDLNPLRVLVTAQFDFERLRRDCPFELFVAAAHANSGRLRLFRNRELSADAVLASACLPTLQHAVIIDGEPYWDGGYAANPAVFPLIRYCRSDDILLVLLSPLQYPRTPRGADEIHYRAMDLGFNSAFMREMRLFALLRDMAGEERMWHGRLERRLLATRFHLIGGDALLPELATASKAIAHKPFLHKLRDAGRAAALAWLAAHQHDVGRRASVDIAALFLTDYPQDVH